MQRSALFPTRILALAALTAPDLPAQVPLRTFRGTGATLFGYDVREVGDVDQDGVIDLVVGVPNHTPDGAVRVISGATGDVLLEVLGNPTSGHFGWMVAPAGDVNADGDPDFMVSDPTFTSFSSGSGVPKAGRAEVRSGADGSLLYAFEGDQEMRLLGHALDALGDVTGDGFDDFAIGVPGWGASGSEPGHVLILSGRDGSVVHTLFGNSPTDLFGLALANAGDVNGDGVSDLAAGATRVFTNGAYSGAVSVRSGFDGSLIWEMPGSGSIRSLGRAVAGVGDLDGDGIPELMATGNLGAGAVVNVLSGANGALVLQLASSEWAFGADLCGVGDADGDGIGDLLVGGPDLNLAYLHSGADGTLLARFSNPDSPPGYGAAVAAVGDFDGDGLADFAIAEPEFGSYGGRVRIHSGCTALGVMTCGPAVPNSTGLPARMRAFGTGAVSKNVLHLSVADLPAERKVLFLTSQTQGFVQNPGGSQGDLCLGGVLGRFSQQVQQSDTNGSAVIQIDLRDMPPPLKHAVLPGETRHFQAWYRDFDPTKTSNFSDALAVTFS